MEPISNENFMSFCKSLGSGTIESKIWFVGIEEGGSPIDDTNLLEQLSRCKESLNFPYVSGNTAVWKIISDLMWEKYSNKIKIDKKEYRNKIFSEDYPHFFLTELFPLPKPNTSSWSDNYVKIFGYSKNDYFKYLSDVRSIRFPIIYKKWLEVNPLITICFGSSYWDKFINLFKLGHSRFINIDGSGLRKYPKENILLTPFFGYRTIRGNDIETLKQAINNV